MDETLLPLPGRWTVDAELGGDLLHWATSSEGEDHLRSLHALSLAIGAGSGYVQGSAQKAERTKQASTLLFTLSLRSAQSNPRDQDQGIISAAEALSSAVAGPTLPPMQIWLRMP